MTEEKLELQRVSTIRDPFVISTNETLGYVMNGKTRIPLQQPPSRSDYVGPWMREFNFQDDGYWHNILPG
jgi:hypothetical protein